MSRLTDDHHRNPTVAERDTAVIGRSGGEEFVIADMWHPTEVDQRAQQLCDESPRCRSASRPASAPPAFAEDESDYRDGVSA